ncbi:hypothetical protein [Lutibacter maritimus]|uniref:hypothetical protein n=1 Tax=Lutibacter maritimus TaxID=593133 RepID=UPI000B7FBE38|nr:hypothetical protein [Lutibacter maritimus]
MKLQEAFNFFKSLKTKTTNKYEIKVYNKFLYILSDLQTREFTIDEIDFIEMELDSLNLNSNPENRKNTLGKPYENLKNS